MKRLGFVLSLSLLFPVLASAADQEKAHQSYLQKANQELQEWNTRVADLQKRSEKAGARTRVEIDRGLREVQQKLDAARRQLTALQGSGESGWKTLRRSSDKAFQDLKHAYGEATSFLDKDKHKEEP
jgi:predicted  nucleic acid-binding Zn-ribbon protein